MIVKTARELHEITKQILMAAGANQQNADVVAEHLVWLSLGRHAPL